MTRLFTVVVLVACSGGGGTKTTHPEPVRPDGQGSGKAVAANHRSEPVHSEDRCATLIQHAFALAVKERPPDQKLTDDEHAKIGKQLREAWLPFCERMTSDGYSCALGATTLVDLDRCGK